MCPDLKVFEFVQFVPTGTLCRFVVPVDGYLIDDYRVGFGLCPCPDWSIDHILPRSDFLLVKLKRFSTT